MIAAALPLVAALALAWPVPAQDASMGLCNVTVERT